MKTIKAKIYVTFLMQKRLYFLQCNNSILLGNISATNIKFKAKSFCTKSLILLLGGFLHLVEWEFAGNIWCRKPEICCKAAGIPRQKQDRRILFLKIGQSILLRNPVGGKFRRYRSISNGYGDRSIFVFSHFWQKFENSKRLSFLKNF